MDRPQTHRVEIPGDSQMFFGFGPPAQVETQDCITHLGPRVWTRSQHRLKLAFSPLEIPVVLLRVYTQRDVSRRKVRIEQNGFLPELLGLFGFREIRARRTDHVLVPDGAAQVT